MKTIWRLIFFLTAVCLLAIISYSAFGQGLASKNPVGGKTTMTEIYGGTKCDSFFIFPLTMAVLSQYPKQGRAYYSVSDSSIYYCTGYTWIKILQFTDTLPGRYLETQWHAANTYAPISIVGTVTSVSSGNLSPLFTSSVATATSTPAISYSLSTTGAYNVFCNTTNATAAPAYAQLISPMIPSLTGGQVGTSGLSATGSPGSTNFLRGDNTWSNSLGSATATTQTIDDNTTKISTDAYVQVYIPLDTSIAAAYTLTSRDAYRTLHCTNGSNIALTVPTGLGTRFICTVIQEGAGTVTPTTSSTTFNFIPTATTKTKQVGSVITIRSWATSNTFTIQGDLQ